MGLAVQVLLMLTMPLATANDDRDVIQTAMLSFFDHEDWYSADWKPKSHVVLQPHFRTGVRPDFASELSHAVERSEGTIAFVKAERRKHLDARQNAIMDKEFRTAQEDLAALHEIQRQFKAGPKYTVPALVQPGSLSWDPRIIVTEKSGRPAFTRKDRDKSLEEWTVYAYPEPPSYSPNGRYAYLRLSIPWSIHSADVYFMFERRGTDWVRRVVQSAFYV